MANDFDPSGGNEVKNYSEYDGESPFRGSVSQEFPPTGNPQPAHLGSQSATPLKETPKRKR